jgi:hypothetical protein
MHILAKTLLILSTLVAVALVGAYIAASSLGHSENTSLALHWLSVAAVGFWIPTAGISILLMAISAKRGQAISQGKRPKLEWVISALFLILGFTLVRSRYSMVLDGIAEGWLTNPVLPMLTVGTGLVSLVASVSLALRHKSALHLILLLVLVLFALVNYEIFPMYRAMPVASFLFSASINNSIVMVVLASYIYLRKRHA